MRDLIDRETSRPVSELLTAALNKRGYLVLADPNGQLREPGELITDGRSDGLFLNHPFSVICETSAADFLEHRQAMGWDCSNPPYWRPGSRFWRVQTD